jgi:hypothetical protein
MKSGYRVFLRGILLLTVSLAACSSEKPNYRDNFITSGINTLPLIYLDGAAYQDGSFVSQGWAADREDGVNVRVFVYVDNKIAGEAAMGMDRVDVAAYFNRPEWGKSGWSATTKIPLSAGPHRWFAVVYDRMMGFSQTPEKEITVP